MKASLYYVLRYIEHDKCYRSKLYIHGKRARPPLRRASGRAPPDLIDTVAVTLVKKKNKFLSNSMHSLSDLAAATARHAFRWHDRETEKLSTWRC